jgi:hypothetical protein
VFAVAGKKFRTAGNNLLSVTKPSLARHRFEIPITQGEPRHFHQEKGFPCAIDHRLLRQSPLLQLP